jgi:hypothetical protein
MAGLAIIRRYVWSVYGTFVLQTQITQIFPLKHIKKLSSQHLHTVLEKVMLFVSFIKHQNMKADGA